ncbi:MAG: zf-TFIIB domain-containing protein [Paracoccaceae bacterium]
MKCPIDGTALVIAERSGVEIDYCPQCRGVWLDRGELDKIIDRNSAASPPPAPMPTGQAQHYGGKHKKKKSVGGFLEDLFDF